MGFLGSGSLLLEVFDSAVSWPFIGGNSRIDHPYPPSILLFRVSLLVYRMEKVAMERKIVNLLSSYQAVRFLLVCFKRLIKKVYVLGWREG